MKIIFTRSVKSTDTSYVQDNMNRQLNCFIARPTDTPLLLAEELVQHGFIHTMDSSLIQVITACDLF